MIVSCISQDCVNGGRPERRDRYITIYIMVDVLCYYMHVYHGRCLYCVITCMYSMYIYIIYHGRCTVLLYISW